MSEKLTYPTVILTHPAEADDLIKVEMGQVGVRVIVDPMIETHPIILSPQNIKEICNADMVIFTSKRGVQYATSQINPMCCHDKKVIVVGIKTAQALAQCDVKPFWVSTGQTGKEMCEMLIDQGIIQGKKVVAILAQLADDTLQEYLAPLCQYSRIDIYQTSPASKQNHETNSTLLNVDEVIATFTSSSAVRAFNDLYKGIDKSKIKSFSIGPVTTSTLAQLGYQIESEAKTSTYEGLLQELNDYLKIKKLTQ